MFHPGFVTNMDTGFQLTTLVLTKASILIMHLYIIYCYITLLIIIICETGMRKNTASCCTLPAFFHGKREYLQVTVR